MPLELWRVREHEGLAAVKKLAGGAAHGPLLYPLEKLTPGTYFVCDESGNRLKLTVEDAREEGDAQEGALVIPISKEAGRSKGDDEPGRGRVAG